MKDYKIYTKKQLKFIYKNRTLHRARLVAVYNKKFRTKRSKTALAELCKKKLWYTGRTGRFKKGHIPWAAGTKGLGLCKANKGSFKKGNRPVNWLPVGSEIVNSDGYIKVKIAEPNIWEFKHLLIWKAAHGKVPRGKAVIFKNGKRLNCTLENLELVSRQVLLYLNQHGYADLPDELKSSMMAVSKVEVKVFALHSGGTLANA